MHRALFKMLLGIAVVLGLTLTAAPGATAAPAAPAAAAAAAPDCSTQQSAYNRAARAHTSAVKSANNAQKKVKKVKRKLTKAKASWKKAKSSKTKKAKATKVKKLRKQLRQARKVRDGKKAYAKQVAGTKKYSATALNRCKAGQPNTGKNSPIQALCDAGLPQAVCDGLAGLIPGGSSGSPLAALCAAAPQAKPLCDLLGGNLPSLPSSFDPSTLLDALQGLLKVIGLGDLLGSVGGGGTGGLPGLDTLTDLLTGGFQQLLDILGLGDLPLPGLPGLK